MHSPDAGCLERAARGFTLTELVVALAVGGTALTAFALMVAHQERAHGELARRVRARAHLREGLAPLVTDLRAISPHAGDLPAGSARDSSVELRTTIGSAVVCEVAGQSVTAALASFVAHPEAGDTVWAYVAGDTGQTWTPLPVAAAVTLPADRTLSCPFPPRASSVVGGRRADRGPYALELVDLPVGIGVGTPIRVTRPTSYSLYRSPDSRWYLGRREWVAARGRFETIQPVSGPFWSYAPRVHQTSGLELHYADSAGTEVTSGSAASDRVAQVTIVLRATADGRIRERRDVTSITVAPRNPR